jgi:hypothetical protein
MSRDNLWLELTTYMREIKVGGYLLRRELICLFCKRHSSNSLNAYRYMLEMTGYLETIAPGLYKIGYKRVPKNFTLTQMKKEYKEHVAWVKRCNGSVDKKGNILSAEESLKNRRELKM